MEVTKEGLRRLKIPNTGLAATQAQGEERIFSEQKYTRSTTIRWNSVSNGPP